MRALKSFFSDYPSLKFSFEYSFQCGFVQVFFRRQNQRRIPLCYLATTQAPRCPLGRVDSVVGGRPLALRR
jgi:hypothetical protein